jgi:hypothetical protein
MLTALSALLLIVAALLISATLFILFIIRVFSKTKRPRTAAPLAAPPAPPAPLAAPPAPVTPSLPYARIPTLLTPAERDFLAVLRTAAPTGWLICPQVRLANLVDVRPGRRNRYAYFNPIAAKCVDFVLCDERDTRPLLVVELDDSSHRRANRQARDAFVDAVLASAGLPILHVPWQPRYNAQDLATAIRAAAPPAPAPPAPPAPAPPAALPAASREQLPLALPEPTPAIPVGARRACRHCGVDVAAMAKFCTRCGAPLEL